MSKRVVGSGLAVFACLTFSLVINLTSLQTGTRELAPPPKATARVATLGARADHAAGGGLIVLNDGRTDNTMQAIKRELKALGYRPGSDDHQIGLMTRAAIMAFEYDNGLPLTARADAAQLERLLLGVNPSVPQRDAGRVVSSQARQVMVRVQQSLQQLDYQPGAIDGTFGGVTERAIRRFEIDNNLRHTGRISGELIAALAAHAGTGKVKLSRR